MSDVATAKKGVSGGLLLAVFLIVGALIVYVAVRTFAGQLEEANAAREAEYAAEYAAFDEAFPVEDAGEAAEGEAVEDPLADEAVLAE